MGLFPLFTRLDSYVKLDMKNESTYTLSDEGIIIMKMARDVPYGIYI